MAFVDIDVEDNDGNIRVLRIHDEDPVDLAASGYIPKNYQKAKATLSQRPDYRARRHNRFIGSVLLHGRI